LAFFIFALRLQASQSLRSVCAWCNAGDALTSWREANPTTYISQSDVGKKLLQELIDTYGAFLKNHPFIKDHSHKDYLLSLFDEDPPDPPKPRKRLPKSQKPFTKERLFAF
jgi:hypothetical protein